MISLSKLGAKINHFLSKYKSNQIPNFARTSQHDMIDLSDFLSPKHYIELIERSEYQPHQFAQSIDCAQRGYLDINEADIVLLGCGEYRGADIRSAYSQAPDRIREAFYKMYNWYPGIALADLGNIVQGATLSDTRAALNVVLQEIYNQGKIAILLGGSQDLTLQQYEVFRRAESPIDMAAVDALIDLDDSEGASFDRSYLMDLLTGEPNFVRNYSHIGFQSYYVNPRMLETLDKLRFDFYRLGVVRDKMDEMEPVLRNCSVLSIDLSAVRACDAAFNPLASPNGFFGDEMCMLTRYAGMSAQMRSLGIYGYHPENDLSGQGAQLVAQMIWYFLDGYRIRQSEAALDQKEQFLSFDVPFADFEAKFVKSRITNRWWMQLPDGSFIPCSEQDYNLAAQNEIPERWIREQERLL